MLEDVARYQELLTQKEEEQRRFIQSQSQLKEKQQSDINEMQKAHNDHVEKELSTIQQLKARIEESTNKAKETMDQIKDDAMREILDIDKKNKTNMTQVEEMGLRSKAELQLTSNKLKDFDVEIQKIRRQSQDQDAMLDKQKDII